MNRRVIREAVRSMGVMFMIAMDMLSVDHYYVMNSVIKVRRQDNDSPLKQSNIMIKYSYRN